MTEKGEGIISALYSMLVLTIVLFIGIDAAGYTGTAWKLRNVCSETLHLMKIQNGYDSDIEYAFADYARSLGLNPADIQVEGTPGPVQRGEKVTIRASTPYTLRCLRPFNRELRLTVEIEMSGLAQEFIRLE